VKVLVLSSGNSGSITPFVEEQCHALEKRGVIIDIFLVRGKSYKGYLSNLRALKRKISEFGPDLIHAHYGLSALLANLQRKVPVIGTFHGSDIWVFRKNRMFSRVAHLLSKRSIIVDPKMKRELCSPAKVSVIPCGVDLNVFYQLDRETAINEMDLPRDKINILFASKFDYYEKNYPLAERTMNLLGGEYNLIELKNFSRTQVNYLLNACDAALMTSLSEGSPQFIKEAMACNCPVVSTKVGDVAEIIDRLEGCYLTTFSPSDIASKIRQAVEFRKNKLFTNGREKIILSGLDLDSIATRVIKEYNKIIRGKEQITAMNGD
jgi:teichuronic acid biosynthesis glycosyltransferase TuaC